MISREVVFSQENNDKYCLKTQTLGVLKGKNNTAVTEPLVSSDICINSKIKTIVVQHFNYNIYCTCK